MSDARLIMEPKIAVQIAKALQGHEGNVTINLNMNATQTQYGSNSEPENAYVRRPEDFDLLAFIDGFPQPRMRNLIDHIYYLVSEKYGKQYGARWLGIASRTLYRIDAPKIPENIKALRLLDKEVD